MIARSLKNQWYDASIVNPDNTLWLVRKTNLHPQHASQCRRQPDQSQLLLLDQRVGIHVHEEVVRRGNSCVRRPSLPTHGATDA